MDYKTGSVAEWLGRGLQNLVQRFESARNLQPLKSPLDFFLSGFCISIIYAIFEQANETAQMSHFIEFF